MDSDRGRKEIGNAKGVLAVFQYDHSVVRPRPLVPPVVGLM